MGVHFWRITSMVLAMAPGCQKACRFDRMSDVHTARPIRSLFAAPHEYIEARPEARIGASG